MGIFKRNNLFKVAIVFVLLLTQFSLGSVTNAEEFDQTLIDNELYGTSRTKTFTMDLSDADSPTDKIGTNALLDNLVIIKGDITDTKVSVKIVNNGVDPLDTVTVKVSATGYSEQVQTATKVYPVVGKTFDFNILEISAYMKYKIIVVVTEGGKTQTARNDIDNSYKDSDLADWHKGTYKDKVASVDDHFSRHKNTAGVKTVTQYLRSGATLRGAVMDIDGTTHDTFKIVKTPASGSKVAQIKYTHKTSGRFIIVTDTSTKLILSHG